MTLGDTLLEKGLLHAAHFCYLMANVEFGGLKGNRLYICATTSLFAVFLNAAAAGWPV